MQVSIEKMRPVELPTTPPPLNQRIELSNNQMQQIAGLLSALSRDLDGLPVVLSQQGEVIGMGGANTQIVPERLARAADRLWRNTASHPAREVIRFEEESIEEVERANYMIYSAHIEGALLLSVGWHTAISLTQVRAEVTDVRHRILRLLAE
jgi:hypothetical protein